MRELLEWIKKYLLKEADTLNHINDQPKPQVKRIRKT